MPKTLPITELDTDELLSRELFDLEYTAAQLFDELKHRLRVASDELGSLRSTKDVSTTPTLIQSFKGAQRRILMRLYHHYPALVSHADLMGTSEPSLNSLRFQMSKLRKKLGKDAFVCAPGEGYALSHDGHERIKETLPKNRKDNA